MNYSSPVVEVVEVVVLCPLRQTVCAFPEIHDRFILTWK